MKKVFLLLTVVLPAVVFGQWSNNSVENLIIFNGTELGNYYRTGHTVLSCGDGSVYLTWYDLDTVLNIQRFDQNGYAIWNDRVRYKGLQFSRINALGDDNGNLYLTINRSFYQLSKEEFIIHKISLQGTKEWGENGVIIQDTIEQNSFFSIRWACNKQGDVFLGYSKYIEEESIRVLHRISKDGILPWGESGIILDGISSPYTYFPQILPTRNEGVYVIYGKYYGVHHHDYSYEVYLKKIDLNGNSEWERDPMIFKGWFEPWTINFLAGPRDDYYIAWSPLWLQHFYSDGSVEFYGGLKIIDDTTAFEYTKPELIGLISNGDLVIHFNRKDIYQRNVQFYRQLISSEGQRLLGNSGVPMNIPDFEGEFSNLGSRYWAKIEKDNTYIFYRYPINPSPTHPYSMKAHAFNHLGQPIWPEAIEISMLTQYKSGPSISDFIQGQAIVLWTENTSTTIGIIKAQNIHIDGTLGIKSSSIHDIPEPTINFTGYDSQNRILSFTGAINGGKYTLRNIMGQTVSHGDIKENVILPQIKSGIYILSIFDGQTQRSHKLFIQ